MKTMNYSLIRILFALVIGLVLVLWPNTSAKNSGITISQSPKSRLPTPSIGKRGETPSSDFLRPK